MLVRQCRKSHSEPAHSREPSSQPLTMRATRSALAPGQPRQGRSETARAPDKRAGHAVTRETREHDLARRAVDGPDERIAAIRIAHDTRLSCARRQRRTRRADGAQRTHSISAAAPASNLSGKARGRDVLALPRDRALEDAVVCHRDGVARADYERRAVLRVGAREPMYASPAGSAPSTRAHVADGVSTIRARERAVGHPERRRQMCNGQQSVASRANAEWRLGCTVEERLRLQVSQRAVVQAAERVAVHDGGLGGEDRRGKDAYGTRLGAPCGGRLRREYVLAKFDRRWVMSQAAYVQYTYTIALE
jgi:hypothetical protein